MGSSGANELPRARRCESCRTSEGSQFHHVIDIAPTVLEAAGLPEPSMVNGSKQYPMDGVSMLYTFDAPDAPGTHTVHYDFVYDGGKPGSGGLSRLTIDGEPAGEVRVPRTMPFVYSADEGIDVGIDHETPVTEDYEQGRNELTGRILKVTVEAK